MLKRLLGLCALAVVALSGTAHGAVAYSVNGSTYLQDFNSLPTGATETAVVGGGLGCAPGYPTSHVGHVSTGVIPPRTQNGARSFFRF
mgnify:CR=1 FL=1